MQNFNYHTHTYRCGHADNISDEEFVKIFVEKGFKRMAFTDHCPEKETIDIRKNIRMKYSEKAEYLESIKLLRKKYKNIIEIESGFEVEYLPGQEENLLELKKESDKIIIGQHFIYDDNKKLKIVRECNLSDNELMRYAEYIVTAIEKGIPNIIAHPDLYTSNRGNFDEIDKKVAHVICSYAEKYEIPLEINTEDTALNLMGMRKRITYPCREFWNVATEYPKLKVLYGIDAHFKKQIELYEDAVELANKHIGQDIIDKLNFCDENLEMK